MMKVQQMGIPHRTITSLISHYSEELQKRTFRPVIALKWGDEEKAWNHAIEVIIAQGDHVNNPTEAAFFAVVEVAKQFERQQREIDAIGVGSPSVVSKVEPPETASSAALVAVAPPPGPEDEIEAVPVPSSDVPHSPRRRLVITEDEEVQ
jgi:hypothetical protein